MSDKNLIQVLRTVIAHDIASAPRQHRLRTPQCPRLTRFVPAAHWTQEEMTHQVGCPYCGMMLKRLQEIMATDPEQVIPFPEPVSFP
jgi:hypothetical protein